MDYFSESIVFLRHRYTRHNRHTPSHRGFTLLELIISMTIAVILISIAVPSFSWIIKKNQLAAVNNHLVHSILLAKSAAVTHFSRVTICPSNDRRTCDHSVKWDSDQLIFMDKNNDKMVNKEEDILHIITMQFDTFDVYWKGAFGRNYFQINPRGFAVLVGSFFICPKESEPQLNRRIIVNRGGRIKQAKDDNNNGIVDYNNVDVNCDQFS